jgi:hypothetical protein
MGACVHVHTPGGRVSLVRTTAAREPTRAARELLTILVQSIKSLDERKDAKGQNTFSLPEWWRCNSGAFPHFSFVCERC